MMEVMSRPLFSRFIHRRVKQGGKKIMIPEETVRPLRVPGGSTLL